MIEKTKLFQLYNASKWIEMFCEIKSVIVIKKNFFKFKAEGWELAKCLGSLEQFTQAVKGQNNCFETEWFLTYSRRFLRFNRLEQLHIIQIEK